MIFTNFAKGKLFQPFFVLIISILAAAIYSIYATLKFSGDKLSNQYYYVVPIIIPFVVFLLKRAEGFRQRSLTQWLVDFVAILTAIWRVIGDVPYVSGHTLFLTYCILTIDFNIGRILAAIVIAEVVYLKFFVWNDWISAIVGIALGIIAAVISKRKRPF